MALEMPGMNTQGLYEAVLFHAIQSEIEAFLLCSGVRGLLLNTLADVLLLARTEPLSQVKEW